MAARSDINSHLLTFARPPEPRFRGSRLDTAATSAAADFIVDVMGLAVRSMIYRRVTEDIIANVEIDPPSGGKCRVALGGGCPSVAIKISTPRESGHSFIITIRLIRAIRGFLAL